MDTVADIKFTGSRSCLLRQWGDRIICKHMITRVTTKFKEFLQRNCEASLTIVNHRILLLISISSNKIIPTTTPPSQHKPIKYPTDDNLHNEQFHKTVRIKKEDRLLQITNHLLESTQQQYKRQLIYNNKLNRCPVSPLY